MELQYKVFGKKEDATYLDRHGAYLIAVDGDKIAVIETEKGYFLIGGGKETGESDEACVIRECLEETGYQAVVDGKICTAETYCKHGQIGYFHPIQTYYSGSLIKKVSKPKESDHKFKWVKYAELKGKLYAEMQNWALEQLKGRKL